MLFSCLVDADFIATEHFYGERERDGFTPLPELQARLKTFMADKRARAESTPVNVLRTEILDHAMVKAMLPPGLFTLTVPTGGGKTLASLSFALEHAARHGLRRVIFAIPFTSITEQTAGIFRAALAAPSAVMNNEDVLEHHATFDWERAARDADGEGRGSDAVDRLRRAAENWAAPVVVTTAVQFFESLFAKSPSRCRKLHNLANSVIVLDEAQTIPLHLLRPCVAAIDELARNYGASVVLCTATQPALRVQDGFDKGLDIPPERELAPRPQALFSELKRVEVERFAEQAQMLCIVNTRLHARDLFGLIQHLPGAVHLSTLMCPAHRRRVLDEARRRLEDKQPVRIVSTSLIEAGVDIDLPEVWREAAGVENIAQAAGRCNREGTLAARGRVVVFEGADQKLQPDIKAAWQATREILRTADEPFGLEGIRRYFSLLYWSKGSDPAKGPDALDAATLNGKTYPILPAIAERTKAVTFPFKSIAQAFRMIDDTGQPVIVPWSSEPGDEEAKTILDRVSAMDRPLGPDLRKLQQYTVSIPKKARDEWLRLGVLRAVHPALGDALLRFEGLEHYDPEAGVRLGKMLERDPASNLF
jgi:CRISPR-associated endonuclease/helicase Cas3